MKKSPRVYKITVFLELSESWSQEEIQWIEFQRMTNSSEERPDKNCSAIGKGWENHVRKKLNFMNFQRQYELTWQFRK